MKIIKKMRAPDSAFCFDAWSEIFMTSKVKGQQELERKLPFYVGVDFRLKRASSYRLHAS